MTSSLRPRIFECRWSNASPDLRRWKRRCWPEAMEHASSRATLKVGALVSSVKKICLKSTADVSHLGRVVFSLELSEYTSFLLLIVLVLQYNNYHSRPPLGIASRRIGPRTIDGPSGRLYQQGKHLTCSHPSKFSFTSAGRRHPRVWRWHQPTLLRTRSQPTVGMGRAKREEKNYHL